MAWVAKAHSAHPAPTPCCVQGHQPAAQAAQILGVHVQLVAVQLRQLGVGVLDVVQVLHGFSKGAQHFLTMSTDPGVAHDGSGAGEVPKGGKEPLGPGVDDQQPGFGTAFLHVDFAPDAGDELLLLGGPVPSPVLNNPSCRSFSS
uniref:Uncharacterized protein n=1 Tax=Coturnix japonica TaxID=93934 RepID=A0A8C2T3D6_COTJA